MFADITLFKLSTYKKYTWFDNFIEVDRLLDVCCFEEINETVISERER